MSSPDDVYCASAFIPKEDEYLYIVMVLLFVSNTGYLLPSDKIIVFILLATPGTIEPTISKSPSLSIFIASSLGSALPIVI
jgi:hypothetical protein